MEQIVIKDATNYIAITKISFKMYALTHIQSKKFSYLIIITL